MLLSQLGRDGFRCILCAAVQGFNAFRTLTTTVEPIGVQLKTVHYAIMYH